MLMHVGERGLEFRFLIKKIQKGFLCCCHVPVTLTSHLQYERGFSSSSISSSSTSKLYFNIGF